MTDSQFPDKLKIYVTISGNRVSCETDYFDHPEAHDYIRADLVPTWRDMDSAPKDGTYILVKDMHGDVNVLAYCNPYWIDFIHGYCSKTKPIKWMPIPK